MKATKKVFRMASLWFVLILFILPSIGTAKDPAPQKLSIKLATTMPVGEVVTEAGDMLKKIIEKNSNGRITVQHFPSGQLYNTEDLAEAVPSGAVDIAFCQSGIASVVPEHDLFNMMFMLRSAEETYKVRDALMDDLQVPFNKKFNSQLLGWVNYGNLCLMFTKPVKKLDDFKGLRMRTPGGGHSVVAKSIGIAPVAMSSSDVYLALQRGTIDSVLSGYASALSRKWYEVAKYMSGWYGCSYLYSVPANLKFWRKLTPEDQKIILQAVKEVQTWSDEVTSKHMTAEIEELKKKGVIVVNLPEEDLVKIRSVASKALFEYFGEVFGKGERDILVKKIEKTIGRPLYGR